MILIGVVMKVVRMAHHMEICSEMNKLNHLVNMVKVNGKRYVRPESTFCQCLDESLLFADSDGIGAEKGDSHHGGENNLVKKNFVWDGEFEDSWKGN